MIILFIFKVIKKLTFDFSKPFGIEKRIEKMSKVLLTE